MRRFVKPLLFLFAIAPAAVAVGQGNPFRSPQAKIQYERDRDYDLQNVLLKIKVDWEKKGFSGVVTHTLEPPSERSGPSTGVSRVSVRDAFVSESHRQTHTGRCVRTTDFTSRRVDAQ